MPIGKLVSKLAKSRTRRMFHGSPAKFSTFKRSKIGSRWGQGGGHGFYMTKAPEYALPYASAGVPPGLKPAVNLPLSPAEAYSYYKTLYPKETKALVQDLERYYNQSLNDAFVGSRLQEIAEGPWLGYDVSSPTYDIIKSTFYPTFSTSKYIHDTEVTRKGIINLEKPLSIKNQKKVNTQLKSMGLPTLSAEKSKVSTWRAYDELASRVGEKKVTQAFEKAGFRGFDSPADYEYVIFSPKHVKVKNVPPSGELSPWGRTVVDLGRAEKFVKDLLK